MAQVVVELSGDDAKLFRSYQRIIEQSRKLDDTHKANKRTSEEAFGASAMARFSSYVAGILTVNAAISKTTQLLQEVRQENDRLAQQQRANMQGLGPLAQLAMGDRDSMRRMYAETQQTFMQGAGAGVGEAGAGTFSLYSAGLQKYRREVAELVASGAVPDPQGLLIGAAAMEAAFGTEQTGGFANTVSMALGASAFAPADIPMITRQAALTAGAATGIGVTAPEAMAAVAALATPAGGAEQAKTMVAQLFTQIEKRAMTAGKIEPGMTLEAMMSSLMEQEAGGLNIMSLFREQEAVKGYRMLRENMPSYRDVLSGMTKAVEQDAFTATTQMYEAIPEMAAARAAKQATARHDVAMTERGVYANLADAVAQDMIAETYRRGGSKWSTVQSWMAGGERFVTGDEKFVRDYGRLATPETQEMIRITMEASEALNRAAQNLEGATESNRQRAAVAVQPE